MADDYNPMIEQNVGDVSGDFTKSVTITDSGNTETTGTGSDVEAGVEAIHTIFQYIPELIFVSIYGLLMYAAVLWITKKIKG
jgi:hypothetical protein